MLDIYARTFRIATLTEPREAGRSSAEAVHARPRPRRSWLADAWRRFAGSRA